MALTLKGLLGDLYKEGMTEAEIETALASLEMPDGEAQKKEIEQLKQALSKANSEAAENKRKLREKQTAEEQASEERDRQVKELTEELAALKTEKAVATYTAKFIALGYDPTLAQETAQAMVDGDTEKVFANQQKHQDSQRKKIESELMKKTPTPPAGGDCDTLTREQYRAMSLADKQKLANENPTLYKKMNSEE